MQRAFLPLLAAVLGSSILLSAPAHAVIRVVAQDGSGQYLRIQDAINASNDGDEVVVRPGVYVERVVFGGRVLVVRSTDGPLATVIDADSGGSVVTMDEYEPRQTVLEGFTLRGGTGTRLLRPVAAPTGGGEEGRGGPAGALERAAAEARARAGEDSVAAVDREDRGADEADSRQARFGGGILLSGASAVLRNLIIQGNGADYGGGIYSLVGSPLVEDCRIEANLAGTGAGAVLEFGGTAEFVDCRFGRNRAAFGGGLSVTLAGAFVRGCRFTGNEAGAGGALRIYGGPVTVESSAFLYNLAGEGSSIHVVQGSAEIRGCTFFRNGFPEEDAGELLFSPGTSGVITRTILSETVSRAPIECAGASVERSCNDVFPTEPQGSCPPGSDEIAVDPLFCDPERGDLRLREDSPLLPDESPPGCGRIGAYEAGCPSPADEIVDE
jgi:hypothetical protein